jgi:hypothetical protein
MDMKRYGKLGCWMTEKSVVAIYDRMRDAENAIRLLEQSGYPVNQISIISRDLESAKQVHGFLPAGDGLLET